jgi:hypothetical protein
LNKFLLVVFAIFSWTFGLWAEIACAWIEDAASIAARLACRTSRLADRSGVSVDCVSDGVVIVDIVDVVDVTDVVIYKQ